MFATVEFGVAFLLPSPPKKRCLCFGLKFLFERRAVTTVLLGETSICGRGKSRSGGGAGVKLKDWPSTNHCGANTSMPHPLFGVMSKVVNRFGFGLIG